MFEKLFSQRNFADQVGLRLPLFKLQSYSPYRANFRCPICGDSSKNKYKKRGYFIERDGSLLFHCHNECGTMPFEAFMQKFHNDLYMQYKFELIQEIKASRPTEKVIERQVVMVEDVLQPFIKLSNLPNFHKANIYVDKRRINFDDLWYSENFYSDVNSIIENKFEQEQLKNKHDRLVIPLRDFDGSCFGISARSFDDQHKPKYLTIKFDEVKPKIFGLDRIDRSKRGYVFEGPIDSLFVNNSIALVGTDGDPTGIFADNNFCMVLDNQPRSTSVLKKYDKYINKGFDILIWPDNTEGKDVNQMIMEGWTPDQIKQLIDSNTCSGIKAKIKLKNWAKA